MKFIFLRKYTYGYMTYASPLLNFTLKIQLFINSLPLLSASSPFSFGIDHSANGQKSPEIISFILLVT